MIDTGLPSETTLLARPQGRGDQVLKVRSWDERHAAEAEKRLQYDGDLRSVAAELNLLMTRRTPKTRSPTSVASPPQKTDDPFTC